jgi:hypothetical protein
MSLTFIPQTNVPQTVCRISGFRCTRQTNLDPPRCLPLNAAILSLCVHLPPMSVVMFSSILQGATRNPYNPKATAGGSSGGEAALLASDGSALGIGSDIAGGNKSIFNPPVSKTTDPFPRLRLSPHSSSLLWLLRTEALLWTIPSPWPSDYQPRLRGCP